jgi:two-component system response regulator AtoC
MPRSVLLIDDEPSILRVLTRFFERAGWTTHEALSGEDGVRTYDSVLPDLVILDLQLPGLGGLDVLEILSGRAATVVVLTGHPDVETAVDAMSRGAESFLTKPVDLERLQIVAENAAEKAELRRSAGRLGAAPSSDGGEVALGSSARMRDLARRVELVAASSATSALLLGETGTGKGFVARMIHAASPRARESFVEINCAGLSATFLDSELFGHERGAFTDAREMKRGMFEVADRGTIFLDEIGDLDPALQPKLLKVLEGHAFRRLGGTRELQVNVRVVAATNKDLQAEVRAGRFREDLYYRLSVFPLTVPPLRERSREDVLALIQRFLQELRRKAPGAPNKISGAALALLVDHAWPGNVRELHNALEHALVLARGEGSITGDHLPHHVRAAGAPKAHRQTWDVLTLEELERQHIERTLHLTHGNRTVAASKLGISRATLHAKIKEYRLEQVGRSAPATM